MGDNRNVIVTAAFSSAASEALYRGMWSDDPATRERHENGE